MRLVAYETAAHASRFMSRGLPDEGGYLATRGVAGAGKVVEDARSLPVTARRAGPRLAQRATAARAAALLWPAAPRPPEAAAAASAPRAPRDRGRCPSRWPWP